MLKEQKAGAVQIDQQDALMKVSCSPVVSLGRSGLGKLSESCIRSQHHGSIYLSAFSHLFCIPTISPHRLDA
jgi:hypothetical protein